MNETEYKIRRRIDGKYSNGGSYPHFTKNGKTWSSVKHLNSHLRLSVRQGYYRRSNIDVYAGQPLANFEIVEVAVSRRVAAIAPLRGQHTNTHAPLYTET